MKKLIMILPMALVFCLLFGLQSILAQAELGGAKSLSQKTEKLQEPPYPHDDTPCEEVDLLQIEVPADFSLVYSGGPTHAEWGANRSVTVAADGSYSIKESTFSREEYKTVTKIISEGRIPTEAVKRIYARVVGCKFFELKTSYWNQEVRDGFRETMYVVAQGKTHYVTTYYYRVQRFESIHSTLIRTLELESITGVSFYWRALAL
ncbi:hypothetical protein ACFLT9_06900 [Acidobacteriota bacterium]